MSRVRFLKQNPCGTLLFAQLLGVLLYPFMTDEVVGTSLFSVFGILVLGLVVLAIRSTPFLSWVALLLALPAVVLLVIQAVTGSEALLPWSAGFEAALYFYAAMSMLAYMLDDHDVTTDELFVIGAVFTLLAWAFAYVYVVVQALVPGSFTAAGDPGGERTWLEFLFLSFTTLTSVGLSDIVPIKPHARSVSMIEQVAGVLYVAMVVARMVGLGLTRRGTHL